MEEIEQIKQRIKALGVKKSFVAEKIGVHNVVFSYFLNNKRKLSAEKLTELKNYLGL